MMTDNCQKQWQHLVDCHKAFSLALQDFLIEMDECNRILVMKHALMGRERSTAIYLLQYLKPTETVQLFNELVFLASFSHGAIQAVRDAILAMPRNFVVDTIEQAAEPCLENGTYDEYRRLLELYSSLDKALTKKLAERAIRHEDKDIREAGKDFLM